MKVGPFGLLPGGLAILENAPIDVWEQHAPVIFNMQKYAPWWLGDMVRFGEAQFGDDFWQVPPQDISERMLVRFAGVSRKYNPEDRFPSLSWTHHLYALRIENEILRRSLLRKAESESMTSEDFHGYVSSVFGSRDREDVSEA
jgi:hypothetical protein